MMPNKLSVAIKTALITVVQGPKGQEGGGAVGVGNLAIMDMQIQMHCRLFFYTKCQSPPLPNTAVNRVFGFRIKVFFSFRVPKKKRMLITQGFQEKISSYGHIPSTNKCVQHTLWVRE